MTNTPNEAKQGLANYCSETGESLEDSKIQIFALEDHTVNPFFESWLAVIINIYREGI